MNEHSRPPAMLPTTQAAEGLSRLRWGVADFYKLIDAGVLTEDDRVEPETQMLTPLLLPALVVKLADLGLG
jgi:hypothetical protein